MNILFDVNHPAHLHLFRNAINLLKKQGHNITITSRDKDITLSLLDDYKLDHIMLSRARKGLLGLGIELIERQSKMFNILRTHKIQVCVTATGPSCVHISRLLRIPCLVFYDTDHAKLHNKLTTPFATKFITPQCYSTYGGKHHLRYNGFHDLAYLHPKYFKPDPQIAKTLKIEQESPLAILRFVSWNAAHDIGQKGISLELKKKIIQKLQARNYKIYITSENSNDESFSELQYTFPAKSMLDALNHATIHIGEGGSMATESAIMGTPSMLITTLNAGVFEELAKYKLLKTFHPDEEANILNTLDTWISDQNLKQKWKKRQQKLIENSIDLTEFMVSLIKDVSHKK